MTPEKAYNLAMRYRRDLYLYFRGEGHDHEYALTLTADKLAGELAHLLGRRNPEAARRDFKAELESLENKVFAQAKQEITND